MYAAKDTRIRLPVKRSLRYAAAHEKKAIGSGTQILRNHRQARRQGARREALARAQARDRRNGRTRKGEAVNEPLAIDLFCGLGGWTEGLLAEGYYVVGFDIERHDYGTGGYPAQLVLQDVLTLHGRQFKDAALIVASPPCQAYSYRAMPWKRAKALPPPDNTLFEASFRIQREACEAAGHHIPLVVENVRGAQKWVGRARWNFGSFYLWGDVPALMPIIRKAAKQNREVLQRDGHNIILPQVVNREAIKNNGGSWFSVKNGVLTIRNDPRDGTKPVAALFSTAGSISRTTSGKSPARKAASAMIAKIPLPLAQYIARTFKPSAVL